MIGIVIVSHSATLAEGVAQLASQVAQGRVAIATAGGTGDPDNPIGTDATRVLEAIEAVYSPDGVLVMMDLGSAILSAETALEMLDDARRDAVRLSNAPLVEGTVAAATLAAAGASLDEIVREAECAHKSVQPASGLERIATLPNRLGLHARPAARFIRMARRFDARITLENLTDAKGPVDASSLNGVLTLAARQGHRLRLRAEGSEAAQAIHALATFLDSGCGDIDEAPQASAPQASERELAGIPASEGIALGPLVRYHAQTVHVKPRLVADPAPELRALDAALAAARDETRFLYNGARAHANAEIFDAQALFLEDPDLAARARHLITGEHRDAASAWQQAAAEFENGIRALADPYLSARAADLADAAARVLRRLTGTTHTPPAFREPSILAAFDLVPSDVEKLDPALVLGVCLETGSASAHAAILLRARGIPAVVGLGPELAAIPEGTLVAIDGARGALDRSPDVAAIEHKRNAWLNARRPALHTAPATTRDGHRITVLANLAGTGDVAQALEYGAEGVGVLRTEFLFLDRQTPPTEEEQYAAYRTIAEVLGNRPLVIRTLDIGGDKPVPYLDAGPESNPFLGWRGLRISLDRRDLFETQIRAIVRAAVGHPVEILLPMVSTLSELRRAREIVREIGADIPVGVMIEVPSAAAIAPQLARESARLSIGTNDLVQYVMAADRTNSRVAGLADAFQPAVLRVIRDVVEAGRGAGVKVDVCGEMAADPRATPILLGLGVEELSMSPPFIPRIKEEIGRWSMEEARALAAQALEAESAESVRQALAARANGPSTMPRPESR